MAPARGIRLLFRAVLVALLALAAACSDDGEGGSDDDAGESGALTADEQAYADAFAGTLVDDTNGLSVDAEEADCMAEAIMAELGVDPFEEADVAPEDIAPANDSSPGELLGDGAVSEEQARSIIDVWGADCVDLVEVLVASAGSDFGLDEEGADCFADGLGEGGLAEGLLAGSFTNADGTPDQETIDALLRLLDKCGEGTGNTTVAAIAEELAADGSLTKEQAECLAQGVVDEIGVERMSELFAAGAFDDLGPDAQSEVTGALLQAAAACNVPLSAFG
jgi:hypothetical protein